jgi:hypothetical protein|tara:strand:+ start:394 stop:654 length:261 start_codon:yes stop_codon:yes gene_type:complete
MAQIADGFDDAIIGFTELWGKEGYIVVYDASKMFQTLMGRDGMTAEEATEYFEFNIQGAYVGEDTPIYVWPGTLEQIEELLDSIDD